MKRMLSPFWREPLPLVLASSSAIRLTLLEAAGLPTEAIPAGVDEAALIQAMQAPAAPQDIAVRLARAKTLAVSCAHPGRLVLGADQTLSLAGGLVRKAADRSAAAAQLAALSGREHRLHSAIAIARNGSVLGEAMAHASLQMRPLSAAFIAHYLNAVGDGVLASVGCYQLEGLGIHLFAQISGDHPTILGMPLLPVLHWLRQLGSIIE
jgi:septum formation protein